VTQRKQHSLIEALVNTASGFVISVVASELTFPIMGVESTHSQNIKIVGVFTAISIVRSYFWRRLFNHIHTGSSHVAK